MTDTDPEMQDLLQFFYQCPVGLVELDDDLQVLRINPAAVCQLSPVAPDEQFSCLAPLLERIAPDAVTAIRQDPERLGRLSTEHRLAISSGVAGDGAPQGFELQLVRYRPGRVLVVVSDTSAELRATARAHAQAVQVQRSVLGMSGPGPGAPAGAEPLLAAIAGALAEITDADVALLLLPVGDSSALSCVAAGGGAAELVTDDPAGPLLDDVLKTGAPARADLGADGSEQAGLPDGVFGPALALPLMGGEHPGGVALIARRTGRNAFNETERLRADVFAGNAVLALALAEAAAGKQRLTLLEDRDRHNRAMHDTLIQNLFATGLQLEALAHAYQSTAPDQRLIAQVAAIDEVIRHLRATLTDGTLPF